MHTSRSWFSPLGWLGLLLFACLVVLPEVGSVAGAGDPMAPALAEDHTAPDAWPPATGSVPITITLSGFDPAVVTVTVPLSVTWTNSTGLTQTLVGGEPAADPWRPPRAIFTATLPPGGTFSYPFIAAGSTSFFLAGESDIEGWVVTQSPSVSGAITPWPGGGQGRATAGHADPHPDPDAGAEPHAHPDQRADGHGYAHAHPDRYGSGDPDGHLHEYAESFGYIHRNGDS